MSDLSHQDQASLDRWSERLTAAAELRWRETRSPELTDALESTARILARLDGVDLAPDVEPDFIVPIGTANRD